MFKNIPTFVVNLKRSPERRKYITAHLKSKNIQFKLIEAVDGKTLTPEQIKAVTGKEKIYINNRELLSTEIGCALSHIKVFKRIVSQTLPYALILEDDALIDDAFDADFLEAIPQSWDVLLLGYHLENTEPVPPIPCSFWGRHKKGNFVIAKPLREVARTHGYVVSQQGAQRLLQLTHPLQKPIDSYTGDGKLIKLFVFKKKPIIRVNYNYSRLSTIWHNDATSVDNKLKNNPPTSKIPQVSFPRRMVRKYLDAIRITLRKILP